MSGRDRHAWVQRRPGLVALCAALTVPSTGSATPATSASKEQIVFTAYKPGPGPPQPGAPPPFDVAALYPGGPTVNLTADNPGMDWYSSVSGDGTRIAYVRNPATDPTGAADIFVMGADGSTKVSVTDDGRTAMEAFPNFSPDSTWIAFNKQWDQTNVPFWEIQPPEPWGVRADGTQFRLAPSVPKATNPVISPDGSKLGVLSGGDIWIVGVDGSNPSNLTGELFPSRENDSRASEPDFSPDGESIIFQYGNFVSRSVELYSVRLDGEGLTHLTPGETVGGSPSYSPDGRRIAYVAPASGTLDLWVMNADGSDRVNVTKTPAIYEDWPDWGAFAVPPPATGWGSDCTDPVPTLNGTSSEDALPGTRGADVITAQAGDDILAGGPGKDVLCASDGSSADGDELAGGAAKDLLEGGRGPDELVGGPGNDVLLGGRGNDRCVGGPGRDREFSC